MSTASHQKTASIRRGNDLTGLRFGRLVAISRVGVTKNGNVRWLCQCDCGNTNVVNAYSLRKGLTRSCGCLRRENSRAMLLQNPETRKHIADTSNFVTASGQPVASTTISRRNHSGITGVSFDRHRDKWLARLMVDGKYVLNGTFNSFVSAVSARKYAEREFGIIGNDEN